MLKINFKKIDSFRDWKIISLVFAVGLIILSSFAWNVYLSSQIGGGYFNGDSSLPDITTKTIDQKRLKADILLLNNKSAVQSKVIDPSL